MSRFITALTLACALASPAFAGRHAHDGGPEPMIEVFRSVQVGGATLGVVVTELGPELRAHFGAPEDAGVLVNKVVEGSAAQKAGLRVGDVIARMSGEEISNGMVLRRVVQESAGGEASLDVYRNGKLLELNAEIAQPSAQVRSFGPGAERHMELQDLGELWRNAPGGPFGPGFVVPGEDIDDLHMRIDELEQQLVEMTERMELVTERLQERLDSFEE